MDEEKTASGLVDIDEASYGQYYRPEKKDPKSGPKIVILSVIMLIILLVFMSGILKPKDKTVSYQAVINNICAKAIKYTKNSDYASKLAGINTPGKVVYITLKDLADADLLAADVINPLTNEKIPSKTDIMLKVVSKGNISCSGLAYAEDDRVKPIVTLTGDATITISVGQTFKDPGATAKDNRDGEIDENITRSGTVNINAPGTYMIDYVAIDRAGNLSDTVTRTIVVK